MAKTLKQETAEPSVETPEDELIMLAWGLIANAGEGNWENETQMWQDAAVVWRDKWFAYLDAWSASRAERQ